MSLFIDLLEAVSLSSFGLAAYACLRTVLRLSSQRYLDLLLGLSFGAVAIISILGGFSPLTGILLDGRTVMLTLAGLFGGPIGGVTAALLAGVCRLSLGGTDTIASLGGILAVTCMSVGIGMLARSRNGRVGFVHLIGAGLAAAILRCLSFELLPDDALAQAAIEIAVVPLGTAILLGVLITGVLVLYEQRRSELEKLLGESIERADGARAEAEAANQAKSEFLSHMSHELRTPLNAVIGFAQLMEMETFGKHSDPRYREYAILIRRGGYHLLRLINDVLDLAKVEAGAFVMRDAPFSLDQMARSTLELMIAKAGSAQVRLKLEGTRQMVRIHGDEFRLKQVLINLLSNAIKHTPAGGTVTVAGKRGSNGEIILSVRDTGIGIAAEDLDKLFKPFGQLEGSHTRKGEGTGLGLVISRSLVEAHHGTLTLESAPGQGTTAIVTLPAARAVRRNLRLAA